MALVIPEVSRCGINTIQHELPDANWKFIRVREPRGADKFGTKHSAFLGKGTHEDS